MCQPCASASFSYCPLSILLTVHIPFYLQSTFHSTSYSHTHVVADRGVSWAEASSLAQQAANRKGSGFYRSKREQYHRHLYLLALQKESASHLFNIIRCVTFFFVCHFLLGVYRHARDAIGSYKPNVQWLCPQTQHWPLIL